MVHDFRGEFSKTQLPSPALGPELTFVDLQYVQCCNAQGSETSTACDATGPPGAPLPPTKA